jgi:uncharacterized protein (TIGR00251 family)
MKREIEFNITNASGGAAFPVRVVTRASRSEVVGVQEGGILKVRLTGSPDDGTANQELVEVLAKALGVEPKQVEIVAGTDKRDKLISVDGLKPDVLEAKFNSFGHADEAS